MYRKEAGNQLEFEDFCLPFGGKLRSDNRWVILSKQIPWQKIEQQYAANFNGMGCPAKPARVALGSLIIKERMGTTDRETVQQIAENPYLQYFLGFGDIRLFDLMHAYKIHTSPNLNNNPKIILNGHFLKKSNCNYALRKFRNRLFEGASMNIFM